MVTSLRGAGMLATCADYRRGRKGRSRQRCRTTLDQGNTTALSGKQATEIGSNDSATNNGEIKLFPSHENSGRKLLSVLSDTEERISSNPCCRLNISRTNAEKSMPELASEALKYLYTP